MNKDALLATVIGFGVGLILAGLVFLGPNAIKYFPKLSLPQVPKLSLFTHQPKQNTVTPTPMALGEMSMIDSPLSESIEQKNETLISGNTEPNTIVVVEGETQDTVVTANKDGAYAAKVILSEGKNTIVVTSHAGAKTQKQTVIVYYTPEEL